MSQNNGTEEFLITEIPILLESLEGAESTDQLPPHFFMKWFKANRRYRVSISFKYLYKKWGLRVNIFRNLERISPSNLEFIYKLLGDNSATFRKIDYRSSDDFLGFRHFLDTESKSEIFIFERMFQGKKNKILVFLSKKYWNIDDYVKAKNELV